MQKKTDAQSGDYVEVHLTKLIYEGVLLESAEDEKDIVLLKLDSGYNIGFNKKDVLIYIKNIIKEAFQKGYLKSSSKGISGGHLSDKTINCLKQ